MRKPKFRKDGSKPSRPIVAKFQRFKQKEQVKRSALKLKGKNHYGISDHFPKEVNEKRKKLWPIYKRAKLNGHKAVLNVDKLYISGTLYKPKDKAESMDNKNSDMFLSGGNEDQRYQRGYSNSLVSSVNTIKSSKNQGNDSFSDLKERKDSDVLPVIIVHNSSNNSSTNISPRKFIANEVPNSTLVGSGEDSDMFSIPNHYDEFTSKTEELSSCRNLSIISVPTIADDSKNSVNKECENSNDHKRQVLS